MSNLLVLRQLSKTFPGQVALDRVDLTIGAGRTHALVGQNGSGKSTLIKVLAGYHQPDPGSEAEFDGAPLRLGDGRAAHAAGIRFVHQDLGLVDTLSAAENIAIGAGYTTRRGWRIHWRAERDRAARALSELGFADIDVTIPVGALSPSQRTATALARALHGWERAARLLVLDEPTASLPGADVARLFEAIRILKSRGVAILYVSHHLDEVFEITDDVTVLRDGKHITTQPTSTLDHDSLIELMIGHKLERVDHRVGSDDVGEALLDVRGLRGVTVQRFDLRLRAGEVVGIAGITGSGREAVIPLITGQVPSDGGQVIVGGRSLPNYDPGAARRAGLAFVPAERAANGIVPLASVVENLVLADTKRHWRGWRLRHREEDAECRDWIGRLAIRTTGTKAPIGSLSGGNQQKVLFGRCLRLGPSVLVLDQPTSGIDVGAKDQIMRLVSSAARSGAAVLVASTDSDELVQLCDRVLVMVEGSVLGELAGADLTTEQLERMQLLTTKALTQ